MRALAHIRCCNWTWRVCPWASLRSALISLVMVAVAAVVFDRWVLARLERQGLVASESWKRHNSVVIANHQAKDRHLPVSESPSAGSSGVRAWVGHPVSPERTTGRHRLLVMGDSFVWDSPYLTLNHMWWRQLAIELKRRGYHDVEVIAAGKSGMSTHEELDLARKVLPEFRPDLILWGFVTNDPDERIVKQIHHSQLALPIPGRVQNVLQQVTPRLLDLFKTRRNEKLAKAYLGPQYGYEYSDWLKRIHEGDNFDTYKQTVLDVSRFLSQVQTPGILVTLPEAPIAERFDFSYDKVLLLWRDAGIPVLDNLPAFIEKFPNAEATGPNALLWGINPADGHPGPRSTAFLARQTADRLEREYPQFLGQKSSGAIPIRINDWLPYNLDVVAEPNAEQGGRFELTYPDGEKNLPTMPLGIPTVLIAFEQPLPLRQIQFRGKGLKSAQLWLSTYDPVEFYDRQDWIDLGQQQGDELVWNIPPDLANVEVSFIAFHADVSPQDRQLLLELHQTDTPVATRPSPPAEKGP